MNKLFDMIKTSLYVMAFFLLFKSASSGHPLAFIALIALNVGVVLYALEFKPNDPA